MNYVKKINLHWFCTQNHILEPFSVRHACTKSYVTSEPYPRASQIWCQNVRETWKKKVMKEECEILSGIDAPLKKRQGGAIMAPPPGKLGLIRARHSWIWLVIRASLRVHFAQTLSAGNVLYQKHYTCTPASAGIVHVDATVQSTECHMPDLNQSDYRTFLEVV